MDPVAVALKLAVPPTATVRLVGEAVMLGGDSTVRVAAWLVTVPTALLTKQLNCLPESVNWTLLVA